MGFSQNIIAGPHDLSPGAEDSSPENQESAAPKTISNFASPQDSIRLRRDLDEYARTVDPAHVQIEERRRVMHQRLQERFSDTDRDNDGTISRLEAVQSMPQIARRFNEVDINGDNLISLDELESLQTRISERQRAAAIRVEATPEQVVDNTKRKNKDAMLANRKHTL